MIVGSAGNYPQTRRAQSLSQNFGIVNDLLLVCFEIVAQSFTKRDGFCGNDMNKRAALHAREYAAVEVLCKFFAAEDQASSRAAQSLMRRRRYKFAMRNW